MYFIRGKLYDLSCESWNNELDEDIRQKMARMATSAAWGLGETIYLLTNFVNLSIHIMFVYLLVIVMLNKNTLGVKKV